MMKKILCLLLCLLIPVNAFAAVRMPSCRGAVTDDANVLSAQTAADLAEYAHRLENETGISLLVALVHFLDGAEVQSYAQTLFDLWGLGGNHVLIVGAAGEDCFAAVTGNQAADELGASNAENLLYTSSDFASLFKNQQYDAAFASFCTAFNALLEKQTGSSIRMNGLFGQTEERQPVSQTTSELWNEVMEAITESSERYQVRHEEQDREENGITAGGWIVLIILFVILFRQNKRNRFSRRRERKGCLGWLFSLLGINLIFNLFKKH